MSHANVRAALEVQIASLLTSIGVGTEYRAWENIRFEPRQGNDWARMTFIPVTRQPAAIGPSVPQLHEGLQLIDLFFAGRVGPGELDDAVETVLAGFSVHSTLSSGGTTVRFRKAERSQGRGDGPWYTVSVSVTWYAYF